MKRLLTAIMSKVNADDKKEPIPLQYNDELEPKANDSHSVGKDFHNILFLMFLYLLQGIDLQ